MIHATSLTNDLTLSI